MEAILFLSHGSRSEESRRENAAMAGVIQEKTGFPVVEYAFLEASEPGIPEGIKRCAEKGATRITVLLNFLNSGRHVLQDIPVILEAERKKYAGIEIIMTPPVGTHPRIADLFSDLVERTRSRER